MIRTKDSELLQNIWFFDKISRLEPSYTKTKSVTPMIHSSNWPLLHSNNSLGLWVLLFLDHGRHANITD